MNSLFVDGCNYDHVFTIYQELIDYPFWSHLSSAGDMSSISIITQYPEKIHWASISDETYCINIVEPMYAKVSGYMLCAYDSWNRRSNMYIKYVNWICVREYENQWYILAISADTVKSMRLYPKKRNWDYLSRHIMWQIPISYSFDKYDLSFLHHRCLYMKKKQVDYEKIISRMNNIKEELIAASMHPKRLERHLEMGGEIDDF